jgi:hypothetical protein
MMPGRPRNLGRFKVPLELLEESLEAIKEMLTGCVVLRSECLYHLNAIEYVAIHDDFALVAEGDEVPSYWGVMEQVVAERTEDPETGAVTIKMGRPRFVRWQRLG